MSKGTLSVSYELPIPNFVVRDPGPFTQQLQVPFIWTATLRPSEAGLELLIQISTDDPAAAASFADVQAQSLAEYLTFWLCEWDINHKVVPRRVAPPSFQSAEPHTLHAFTGEYALIGQAATLRLTRRVPGQRIAAALADFSLRQAAPPPVTTSDVVVARQMYIAGLSVENRVASFLIIYAALAVVATFKAGARSNQSRIDDLLIAEDPTIPISSPPQSSGKTFPETEFTAARNDFIHAEDRGRDPAAVIARLESLTPRFQTLVGRILRKG